MASGLDRESRRFYRKESQTDLTRFWDGGEHYASRNRWCFECAWECANKGRKFRIISSLNFISVKQESDTAFVIYFLILVGGIYTVIRSKTSVSVNEMGDQYVCIGPYVEMKARAEVEEEDFPPHHPLGIFYFHTIYRNY